mmetsp:Transcript_124571/g.248540  ORF Transcript_124571/g.248540 Transcript_124571/m.248540 type:complete len:273 (-) Transcript_124571:336-1154(-)
MILLALTLEMIRNTVVHQTTHVPLLQAPCADRFLHICTAQVRLGVFLGTCSINWRDRGYAEHFLIHRGLRYSFLALLCQCKCLISNALLALEAYIFVDVVDINATPHRIGCGCLNCIITLLSALGSRVWPKACYGGTIARCDGCLVLAFRTECVLATVRNVHLEIKCPISVAIAHAKALDVDDFGITGLQRCIAVLHSLHSVWHIVASVGLAKDIKRAPLKAGKLVENVQQSVIGVISSNGVIGVHSGVRKTNTGRLLHKNHSGCLVPTIRV